MELTSGQTRRAEVISIGDEITSGVRLDTNSQWISQRLGEIGIQVAFHSTVGDDLADNIQVFRIASERVDIIVATGGLGPTADDLTRQAIAEMAGVSLIKHPSVLDHIKQMYTSRGREMPPRNESQAWFPAGATIIDNPEGTAPGIDFASTSQAGNDYRIFALPGVPVEMKQMWAETVHPALSQNVDPLTIHHHTIHCFGTGESHIESLLPMMIERGRDPQVGITASAATISLRISTRADSIERCLEKMQPSIDTIKQRLGSYVFGENGQQLEGVVVDELFRREQTIAIADAGLMGAVANLIAQSHRPDVLTGSKVFQTDEHVGDDLEQAAAEIARITLSSFGVAIGVIDRDLASVAAGNSFYDVVIVGAGSSICQRFRFGGHSGWRETRAAKEVLNYIRLHLASRD